MKTNLDDPAVTARVRVPDALAVAPLPDDGSGAALQEVVSGARENGGVDGKDATQGWGRQEVAEWEKVFEMIVIIIIIIPIIVIIYYIFRHIDLKLLLPYSKNVH